MSRDNDHTYCKDPERSYRILLNKFDEENNDIPCQGHGMQGEDKLIWSWAIEQSTTSKPAQPAPGSLLN